MATGESSLAFEQVKAEYLEKILEEIRSDAAKRAGGGEIRSVDAFRAFENYFGQVPQPRRRGFSHFLEDNVFLLAAMLLTITFGAFGLYHPDDGDVASFLDIAKIFAGAVVGGAAGSSAVSLSRRKAREGGK
jgi:hypothetical protein